MLPMINEKIIKHKVDSLLLQYRLQSVTLDNLVYIIEDQGYEIVEFAFDDLGTQHLLNQMGLADYAKERKAFTYKQGLARFVFVFDELSAKEKLVALAHEVGHIICSHLRDGNTECTVDEEYEANEFAHHLLHPGIWLRFKVWLITHKKRAIAIVLVVLALIIGAIIIKNAIQSRSYYGEYYITESGEKYHEADCIFVKDKTNIERLTEKDYYSGEYEACQICLPED